MDDVVAAGSERAPLRARWLVAAFAVLVPLAGAGAWRASTTASSHRATTSSPKRRPAASYSPPFLGTLGSLPRDPMAMVAPAYGAGEGVTVLLQTDSAIERVATMDDQVTTAYDPGATIQTALAVPGGYATALSHVVDGEILIHETVVHLDGREPLRLPGDVVLPGSGEGLWSVRDDVVRRWDVNGDPVGDPVPLPRGWFVETVTPFGLALYDDNGRVEIWDPERRRVVRTLARNGFTNGSAGPYVLWQAYCPDPACPLHEVDLRTGADHLVARPDVATGSWQRIKIDPVTGTVAFTWSEGAAPTGVYVAPFGAATPRLLGTAEEGDVFLGWSPRGRLAVVQFLAAQTAVYGFDGDVLRYGASFPFNGEVVDVVSVEDIR